jgi:hypothetical protein
MTYMLCFLFQKQWFWDNPLKFTNLKHLQFLMFISSEDVDKILYSLAFLRATPLIEKLEVHVSNVTFFNWFLCYNILLILAIFQLVSSMWL